MRLREDARHGGIFIGPLFVQLVIPLSKQGEPLFRQVYLGLRQAILGGMFRSGARLPSTRDLAEQLGISRTVALLAYEQLLAEGFVIGRGGSGTYVAEDVAVRPTARLAQSAKLRLSRFGSAAAGIAASIDFPERRATHRYDFAYGRSDVECFPFELWWRILQRRARRTAIRMLDYGPPEGSEALREAISAHLRRSRTVKCDTSQVIVVNGSQQALDLIARVLIEPGDRVAIEDPCYQGTREVLRAIGGHLHAARVDHDGLDPSTLPESARLAFVTPSHQFPTGAILSLARRQALLAWASNKNAVIVEDDYDGEFRYAGKPLESLQGLDADGRVIYLGTFSRTMFSALRIGYLVAPKSLVPAFAAAKWLCDRHSPTLEQETLAEFISTGMYERHLRRLRRKHTASRLVLLDSLHKFLRDRIETTGDGAGAHIVVWPEKKISEDTVIAAAAARGVGIYGVRRYFLKRPARPGILLGYSRLRESEIREGVKRLAHVI